MNKNTSNAAEYIVPLNMNGLRGRMLHMPAPQNSKREILFVYGHHSTLERWWGLMKVLNRYGAVTMPDLPGFGGMDSFYKIGDAPSIDNLADYLAAFIKMRYKRKRVTIAGMSFGFVIATRMLQRYPDLAKKVDLLVSLVGFAHHDDFVFSKPRMFAYRLGTRICSWPGVALVFRYSVLHPWALRTFYHRTHNAKQKFAGIVGEELEEITKFEIHLWHANDVRTHMRTNNEFLRLNNCKVGVKLPVYHVAAEADRYFDNVRVEQHMRQIFSDFHLAAVLKGGNHAPSVIADEKAASVLIPNSIKKLLSK
jgi:pimeloyl-ACP methyl ester carboxylesterase